ncbi:MAG: choice-of-anchor D domain-containing protein [Bacteroidota bacterium]|jgi:hypothetical protein
MRTGLAARIVIVVLLLPVVGRYQGALAQSSDVSDRFWSIVVPAASALEVDMGRVLVHRSRDSVVVGFLRNIGPVAIQIDTIALTGPDAGLFSVISGAPPYMIPHGESQTVVFRFAPESIGLKTATINVQTQVGPLQCPIRGEGVLPQAEIPLNIVDFGDVYLGTVKDTTISAAIRNAGSTPLTVTGTGQLGPDVSQFSEVSGGGGFTLAPAESRTMTLRFAPVRSGRSTGSIGFSIEGMEEQVPLLLVGNGICMHEEAVLALDTIRARPGDQVDIPVYLRGTERILCDQTTGFRAGLRFNATLLVPVYPTPAGTLENGERTILLDQLPAITDEQGVLAHLTFIAALGNAEGTPLVIENPIAVGGDVTVTSVPGYFLLTGLCQEGGTRLFDATGQIVLRQNRPNPFNAITVIEYEVIEDGPTRLYVADLLGRIVSVLVDDVVQAGRSHVVFDASALSSGIYAYILQTPTQQVHRLMEVVK